MQELQFSNRSTTRRSQITKESSTVSVEKQIKTDKYCLYCGDSCIALKGIPDSSVGLSLYSPPFADLYSYSDDPRDLSNCGTYEEFLNHYSIVVEQLLRIAMPGRLTVVHCMDLPTYKRGGDEIGLKDFPGDIIRLHQKIGWIYHSRFVIWKDPLIAATRTKAIGLAHKSLIKDSSICRTGIPDYLLAFRKPGENPKPISHPGGLIEYYGARSVPTKFDTFLTPTNAVDQKLNKRSHWIWQQYASPVWFDIRQTNVLPFREGKDPDDMKHLCPLQIDVIERCLVLWSNPGDVVLTPFMGVGSEVYVAVKEGRKGIGIELKNSYYRQAIKNVKQAIRSKGFEND